MQIGRKLNLPQVFTNPTTKFRTLHQNWLRLTCSAYLLPTTSRLLHGLLSPMNSKTSREKNYERRALNEMPDSSQPKSPQLQNWPLL
jgi:hypothetical protein